MRARITTHAPNIFHSHQRRRLILRALLSRASQRAGTTGKQNGPTTGKGFVMLDDYTINMSDNLSVVLLPVDPSVGMSALTQSQSADLSGYGDLVQVLYEGSSMSEDAVQSWYEYRADIVNLSDGIYVSQLLLGNSQHLFAV